jgi:hypothetical protein
MNKKTNLLEVPKATEALLLTRQQVAEKLGLCCHSVRALEKRGLLTRVQISRRTIRYRTADVEKLITEALA